MRTLLVFATLLLAGCINRDKSAADSARAADSVRLFPADSGSGRDTLPDSLKPKTN